MKTVCSPWTDEGLRTYRRRFAQFGIRIETITTYEDYRTALQRSAAGLQDQLLAIATDGPRSLERNLLVAVAKDDQPEYRRLMRLLEARNRLGLQVVDQRRER
ncbi:MAG: hypothetical protein IPK63_10255 [Candidatus Competibacteraceae bacterium]|nr:hypothetical protein [Candidatus Competibacteraceae bacterium]